MIHVLIPWFTINGLAAVSNETPRQRVLGLLVNVAFIVGLVVFGL